MNGQNISYTDNLIDLLEQLAKKGIGPTETAKIVKRYIELKARNTATPLRGTFELTPLCNLNCKMCYAHLTKAQLEQDQHKLLNGKQWISIIKQAIDLGMLEATLTGGEALLHPDFEEIFLFLEKHNISVNLKTNGLLLDHDRVSFLKSHHLSNLQISLYGYNDDSYNAVTEKEVFSQVESSIKRVYEANIPVEIVITPSKYLWDHTEKLLLYVNSLGLPYTVNPGLVDPLEETGRAGQSHDITLDQYIHLLKFQASLNGHTLNSMCAVDIPPVGNQSSNVRKGMRCAAGRSVFSVTWRGHVLPCRLMEKISFDGLSIPFSQGWKYINNSVKEYPFPSECDGCSYEMVCPSCVVQHEMGVAPGHVNPAICQRAKRMAAEGFFTKK